MRDADVEFKVSHSTTGCTTSDARTNSYGTGFNDNGGGVYAMEWTSTAIKVWFFPRGSIPSSISAGNPDVVSFGQPVANLAGSCDLDTHFFNHSLVFDTTFCGTWAGNAFTTDGCAAYSNEASWPSCVTYVAENPTVFESAYWAVNSIKVYQAVAGAASAVGSLSSVTPKASTVSDALTSASIALGASTTDTATTSANASPSTTSSAAASWTSGTASESSSSIGRVATSTTPLTTLATSVERASTLASTTEISTSSTSPSDRDFGHHHHTHTGLSHQRLNRHKRGSIALRLGV